MTSCPKCGESYDDGVKFCTTCGTPVVVLAPTPTPTSIAAADSAGLQQTLQPGEQHQAPTQTASQDVGSKQPPQAPNYNQPAHTPQLEPLPTPQPGAQAIIGTFGWLGTLILFAIPVVGLILCIVWAFGSSNLNRRYFSRACLILSLITIALSAVFALVLGPMAMAAIKDAGKPYMEQLGQLEQIKDAAGSLFELPIKGGGSINGEIPNTGGRLTINKISSDLNGKYVIAYIPNPSLIACDGFSGNESNARVNLGLISDGSVTLNVWKKTKKSELVNYNGNDKGVKIIVSVSDTASIDNNSIDQASMIASTLKGGGGVLTGTFSNGKGTADGSAIFAMP